jgi:hypothetical protein
VNGCFLHNLVIGNTTRVSLRLMLRVLYVRAVEEVR